VSDRQAKPDQEQPFRFWISFVGFLGMSSPFEASDHRQAMGQNCRSKSYAFLEQQPPLGMTSRHRLHACSVTAYHLPIPMKAVLAYSAHVPGVPFIAVHIHETVPFLIAIQPTEMVCKGPCAITQQFHPVADRLPAGQDVPPQVINSIVVVNSIALDKMVEFAQPVFGDHDRQGVTTRNAAQANSQAHGVDGPVPIRGLEVRVWLRLVEARNTASGSCAFLTGGVDALQPNPVTGIRRIGQRVIVLKSAEFSPVFARPRLAARGPRSSSR